MLYQLSYTGLSHHPCGGPVHYIRRHVRHTYRPEAAAAASNGPDAITVV